MSTPLVFQFPSTAASLTALEAARSAAAAPVPWNLTAESVAALEQWESSPFNAREAAVAQMLERLAELLAVWHIDLSPVEFLTQLYDELGGADAQGDDVYLLGCALRAACDSLPSVAAGVH